MENTIKIVTELCQEDRNRLDTLIAIGLELVKKNVYDVQPVTAIVPETTHPVDAPDVWGQPEEAAPAEEPVKEEPVKEITAEELLALVQKLAAPGSGKRDKAKAIVQAYGAKVSDVPADKRQECMDKLIELDKAVVE